MSDFPIRVKNNNFHLTIATSPARQLALLAATHP